MDFREATNILSINDIYNISDNALKKLWKNKIKEVHPDKVLDKRLKDEYTKKTIEINTAYRLIVDMRKALKKNKVLQGKEYRNLIIISLEDLIKIYNGECVRYNNEKINKAIINNSNVVIQVKYKLEFMGVTRDMVEYIVKTPRDIFKLDIKLKDNNLKENRYITFKICGKKLEFNMSTQVLRLILPLDFNVNVEILLERVGLENG